MKMVDRFGWGACVTGGDLCGLNACAWRDVKPA